MLATGAGLGDGVPADAGVLPGAGLECRRMAGDSHRVAVVDIGTNSTRLLIADVEAGGCRRSSGRAG